MGSSRYCLNCGFIFFGQRTGKCPNCDQSALTEEDRFYPISPDDIRRFEEFDRKGREVVLPRIRNKNIALIQASPKGKGKWVSLSVLGAHVTYADYGQGPEVIVAIKNNDGFGLADFPEKIMLEAVKIAADIMAEQ